MVQLGTVSASNLTSKIAKQSSTAGYLDDVISLARLAGAAIMDVYQNDGAASTLKSDNSPLTLADIASHKIIEEGLSALSPSLPVLSEESDNVQYVERIQWSSFWLVDPLDGTKEFIKRNGEFTVNIALIENGVPILGVVYAPALDVLYFASVGSGAFVQYGQKPACPIQVKSAGAGNIVKVVASRSHRDARTDGFLHNIGRHEYVSMGSSLKLCLVAEGVAHVYPRLAPTMEWDTAAAHAIVSASGGIVCDLAGVPLAYNKPDLHNPEFMVLPIEDQHFLELV